MRVAEVLYLADYSDRRKNPTTEYEELAAVIELPHFEIPTQRVNDPNRIGHRAMSNVIVLDEKPQIGLSAEGKVTRATGRAVVLLHNYADSLKRDSLCLSPDEQIIIENDIADIMSRIEKMESFALALAEQGNGVQFIKQVIEQDLYNSRPDLYEIACPEQTHSAQ